MALGYVMTAHIDESDTDRDYVLNSQGDWLPVAQIVNPQWVDDGIQSDPDANGNARYIANPDAQTISDNEQAANVYLDSQFSIEAIRDIQGQFQQQFTDRDVRMARVDLNITFV